MTTKILPVTLIKAGLPNETVFVLGSHGSGKTTLIANLIKDKDRFIIFDSKEDYPQSFFPGSVVCDNPNSLISCLNTGNKRIIYQSFKSRETELAFEESCDLIYRWHIHNQKFNVVTWFVHDELNSICSTHECGKNFSDILQRGRSVGIKKVFGAQWFGTIPTWVRDGFSEIYVFRHTDESGLDRLSQFGFNPDDISELPQYVCLYSGKNKTERISLVPDKAATKQITGITGKQ